MLLKISGGGGQLSGSPSPLCEIAARYLICVGISCIYHQTKADDFVKIISTALFSPPSPACSLLWRALEHDVVFLSQRENSNLKKDFSQAVEFIPLTRRKSATIFLFFESKPALVRKHPKPSFPRHRFNFCWMRCSNQGHFVETQTRWCIKSIRVH